MITLSSLKSEPFKVAIIGTGYIAQVMADALRHSKDIRVVAVASRTFSKAASFAKKNHISNAFGSYEELINADGYDMVYVATINSTHFDITCRCLKAGKPVLVEKPICLNGEQVKKIVLLSKETGTFLAEAMILRFSSNMRRVRQIIKDGSIGRVHLLASEIGFNCWGLPRITEKKLGGGALYDLGIYGITLSDMIFSTNASDVKSTQTLSDGVDSQNLIILSYDDSQSVLVNSVRVGTSCKATIYGEKGRIIIHRAHTADYIIKYCGIRHSSIYKARKNRFVEEIEACKIAIINGGIEPDEYTHMELLRVYDLMDRIRSDWNDNLVG